MTKRSIYKKTRNGEPIEVTARQLTELYEKHEGILASRQYKDLKEMVLVDSNVRDAKWRNMAEYKLFLFHALLEPGSFHRISLQWRTNILKRLEKLKRHVIPANILPCKNY